MITSTKRDLRSPAPANARRVVRKAPPAARALRFRNSRRFMPDMVLLPWPLAAHELRRREQECDRLRRARGARDRGARRVSQVGTEELRGQLERIAAAAKPRPHRLAPLDAFHQG